MNRLAELQQQSNNNNNNSNIHSPKNGNDDAESHGGSYVVDVADDRTILESALNLVDDIRSDLRQIQVKTFALAAKPSPTSTKTKKNSKTEEADDEEQREAKQECMDIVNATAPQIKRKLADLQQSIADLSRTEESKRTHAATVKILGNQHTHLFHQFMKALDDYNTAVSANEKRLRAQTIHLIKIRYTKADGSTVSDAEALELAGPLLESGRTDALFNASKDELAQVLQTRQDILRIERSMRELRQIMDDLNSLINDQGDVLESVHGKIKDSLVAVVDGRTALGEGRTIAQGFSSKYKYFIGCSCLIVILVTVLIGGFASKSF